MPAIRQAVFLAMALPAVVSAAWQPVASEQGKRVEIDRGSIAQGQGNTVTAKGRIMLDKPIVDPKTSASYRIIEIESRYDCAERTHATLRRSYFKEDGELLRQEEVRSPFEMPVRSGTPDDRLLREACRPAGNSRAASSVGATLDKVNELAADLRKSNEALVEQAVKKDLSRLTQQSTKAPSRRSAPRQEAPVSALGARPASAPAWAYEGAGGPEHWGRLRPDYGVCATGRRQSPIDLRDGFAVDLEPIQFLYKPAPFRVSDAGRHLQLTVYGGGIMLLGKYYQLTHVRFHNPSEHTVAGKGFDMEAQLVHRADDGKLAVVAVLLERGGENPVVQTALNNLPLEKGAEVAPPGQSIDLNLLLPASRNYATFMGSMTTPPCAEDVLWMVLKQVQQASSEQLAIFQRLYRPNARPAQPAFGRIIKESR